MKLNLLALSFIAFPLLTAQASNTVIQNWSTVAADKPNSHPVMLSGGGLVPNNSGIVVSGYFDAPDAQIQAIAGLPFAGRQAAWAAVAATFQRFGAAGVVGGGSALNNAGLYKLTASQANPPAPPPNAFIGKNIYTVIGTGASLTASNDIIVFKSTNTFATDPTPEATGNMFGTPLAGTLLVGQLGTPGTYYQAGLMAGVTTTPINALNVIPEPTSMLLGALGLAGIGFMRRRR